MKYLLILIIVLFSNCQTQENNSNKKSNRKSNNKENYSHNNLNIGISLPPDSNSNERNFTLGHLNILNIKSVRVMQSWELREPSNDNFDWQPLIDRLQFYNSNNIKVLITINIENLPSWINPLTDQEKINEFSEFVTLLIDNFGVYIDSIQVGNEWDWEIDTYLSGNTNLFIQMNNALYTAVETSSIVKKPTVILGSISISGLRCIAYKTGLITNVKFGGTYLYTEEELNNPAFQQIIQDKYNKTISVLSNCLFQKVDIHLYDEYWNWSIYKQAFKSCINTAGKNPDIFDIIASEFGGPEPDLESDDPIFKGKRLSSYIETLNNIGISTAYYFKLVEGGNINLIMHPNSFIIDSSLIPNYSYEIMKKINN